MSEPSAPSSSKQARFIKTALHQTPFAVLGATTRDDRRRIVELAEEKSLDLDHDVCQKARLELTNPRTRLSAEIAWLPGVSPHKACQLVDSLLQRPMAIRDESGLPRLAHLNLLAAALEFVECQLGAEDLAEFIQQVASIADGLSPGEVLRDINEDRAVSGFPEVRGVDQLEAELAERKRYYRSAIRNALDRLPAATLIQVMTATVDRATAGGESHAPALLDDLVDTYEVETQGILQREAENVHKLIKAVRDRAASGEAAVKPLVDKLDVVARNWDKIAQPIQLSAQARGIDHEPSNDLAYETRSLAIDLFNDHGMLAQSQRITGLLQEIFSEVPNVSARVEQDAAALEQAAADKDEWASEITYRAEIGLIFKDTLSISPDGVAWKKQLYPLDSITRVRWGGVRKSVNGIPTGTTYTIAFGNRRSEAVVELTTEEVYLTFVAKLNRAVFGRVLGELLKVLKTGRDIRFGEALVRDDGVTLVRHKFFSADEAVLCSWDEVQVWTEGGMFYIGAKQDKKTYVGISYMDDENTHILEQAIRGFFKQPDMRRLSDLLE